MELKCFEACNEFKDQYNLRNELPTAVIFNEMD